MTDQPIISVEHLKKDIEFALQDAQHYAPTLQDCLSEIARLRAREALLERALLNVGDIIDVRECPYSFGHECIDGICIDPGPDCGPDEHKIHRCWLEHRVRNAAAQLAEEAKAGGVG